MVSAIAIKLVTVLLGYVMETHILNNKNYIEIDGAPTWYMKNKDKNRYYSFCIIYGDISSVEKAKEQLYKNMAKNLRRDLDIALYKSFQNFSKDERNMATSLTKVDDLNYFVRGYTVIPYLKYTKKNIIYVGGYILKKDIKHYILKKIEKVKIKISNIKSDEMIKELKNRQ